MDQELGKIIQSLILIADEFDEECDRALQFGIGLEYAHGAYVQVDVNLLRKLRSVVMTNKKLAQPLMAWGNVKTGELDCFLPGIIPENLEDYLPQNPTVLSIFNDYQKLG
jgi:hypothetical protein